ncbi:MAG: GDP-mannose 4,6-dehydratase [Deltaproteobacteria bacterium TMED126]|nr:GDP-mannose 4,6-dehydratase [Deltaproteobacteria bacterium TMED126]
MKKIIITGAAGFIGFHTAKLYINKGYFVLGIDNLNDSYDSKIKKFRIKELQKFESFLFKKVDISNKDKLSKELATFSKDSIPKAIINLAARTGVRKSTENPNVYYMTNVIGALNIAELADKYKIKNLIHASTSSVYGDSKEKKFTLNSETSKPISNYAASKKSSEVLLYAFSRLNNINVTVLRFFTVYGPMGRPDMSPFIFIESNIRRKKISLFGNGLQKRDFTYVDDIVSGIFKSTKLKGFNILNLGNNNPISIQYLLSLVEKNTKKKNIIKEKSPLPEDVFYTSADISKTKKLLNWSPTTNISEGIKKTYNWHIENIKWIKNIKI